MKKKLLIYTVAYNAEKLIESTIERIPKDLNQNYDVEILISDDSSIDRTFEISNNIKSKSIYKLNVIKTSQNLGYGGNQKIGYKYAIENNFDFVILLHGDGQYSPELINKILKPLVQNEEFGLVLGSRMMNKFSALKGRMPFYKFIGNIILSKFQNILLGTKISEFHTGYRAFNVKKLKSINFILNTNNFHFDTEIIIQFIAKKIKISEIPINTFYGDEVCHVNGWKYATNVIKASLKYRLMSLGLFYDPKYEVLSENKYQDKLAFISTHKKAYDFIDSDTKVLDLGCADGYLSKELEIKKRCEVLSYDYENKNELKLENFSQIDLNKELPNINYDNLDYILMLDVIEHLFKPEIFMSKLQRKLKNNKKVKLIFTTGNVCFFITRIMMLLGQFNYGPRGILDMTHTRLFTFKSFSRLIKNSNFNIINASGIPAPFGLAIGNNFLSKFLTSMNIFFIKLSKGFFSYQMIFIVEPKLNIDSEYIKITKNINLD